MMTDDQRRAIEADCARLILQYFWANDAHDWAQVAGLFAPEGRYARPSQPGNFVTGRGAILDSFTSRPARAQRHVVANILVEVESATRATAKSVLVLYMGDAPALGELPRQDAKSPMIGFYHDIIVLTDEGWRFAERNGGLDFAP